MGVLELADEPHLLVDIKQPQLAIAACCCDSTEGTNVLHRRQPATFIVTLGHCDGDAAKDGVVVAAAWELAVAGVPAAGAKGEASEAARVVANHQDIAAFGCHERVAAEGGAV